MHELIIGGNCMFNLINWHIVCTRAFIVLCGVFPRLVTLSPGRGAPAAVVLSDAAVATIIAQVFLLEGSR